jgi:hypothetical protein
MEHEFHYVTHNSLRMNSTLTQMNSIHLNLSWDPFHYYFAVFPWAFQVVSVFRFSEHAVYVISLCLMPATCHTNCRRSGFMSLIIRYTNYEAPFCSNFNSLSSIYTPHNSLFQTPQWPLFRTSLRFKVTYFLTRTFNVTSSYQDVIMYHVCCLPAQSALSSRKVKRAHLRPPPNPSRGILFCSNSTHCCVHNSRCWTTFSVRSVCFRLWDPF